MRLFQKDTAERLGVDKTILQFWENGKVKPSLRLIPKIIEFLGYNPYEPPFKSLGEKIMSFRRIHGLSRKKLAMLVGIDHSIIKSWERGEHSPPRKL